MAGWKRNFFKRRTKGKKKRKPVDLEGRFRDAWLELCPDLPRPTPQHRFHPKRRWRFDFAWPEYKVAVEIHGGAFVRGGHTRGIGQAKDLEKARAALRLGWRLYAFNTHELRFTYDTSKRGRGKKKKSVYSKFTVYDCVLFVAEELERAMVRKAKMRK